MKNQKIQQEADKMRIIPFQDQFRDDMIFMILEAKNALGRVPGLNEDLLDIQSNYFNKGDMFWIAVDEQNRVIGSVGFHADITVGKADLHRLFVKFNRKRQGIGSALLKTAEDHLKARQVKTIYVHLGNGEEWFESRLFYTKHGFTEYATDKMKKEI